MPPTQEVLDLRHELAGLHRRVDELEVRLETRMTAIELKEAADLETMRGEVRALNRDIASVKTSLGNLESLQRANHMAQVHLWGVTARYLKIEEDEIQEAQRRAEDAMRFRR